MGKFVGVSVVIFAFSVAFVALAQGPEMAALLGAFRSEPVPYQIAWAVIVLVPLAMLPFGAWLWSSLSRERQTAVGLEQRLDGVRARVKDLGKTQTDAEAEVARLTHSDPENAIAALQRRISQAERFTEIQHGRNAIVDLDSRVAALRAQQQALKDRLAPVLEARHAIEQLFAELDGRQSDIEQALTEVTRADDGAALDLRLKNVGEFVRQSNFRCDQIEHASKTLAVLSEACAELRTRLSPFAASEDGIVSRVRRLASERDQLAAGVESLERLPEGLLTERVQQLSEDRKKLDDGIGQLGAQFASLATLRRDVGALSAGLDRALGVLSIARREGADSADMDARVDEVSRFIAQTQTQFDEIERRVTVFEQLKSKLGELQSRLEPLESENTGVAKLIEELSGLRENLIVRIRRVEGGGSGDLAERVKTFAEAKQELEDRVASLADQFTRLSTIRKDLAGLFDKLASAVSASAN